MWVKQPHTTHAFCCCCLFEPVLELSSLTVILTVICNVIRYGSFFNFALRRYTSFIAFNSHTQSHTHAYSERIAKFKLHAQAFVATRTLRKGARQTHTHTRWVCIRQALKFLWGFARVQCLSTLIVGCCRCCLCYNNAHCTCMWMGVLAVRVCVYVCVCLNPAYRQTHTHTLRDRLRLRQT